MVLDLHRSDSKALVPCIREKLYALLVLNGYQRLSKSVLVGVEQVVVVLVIKVILNPL